MVVGMAPYTITSGRAEADCGQQKGDDEYFLFHNRDFKSGKSFHSPIGGLEDPDVY
jgi:hypothetical protein